MLHDDGVKIVMLTGDNRHTAEAVAKKWAFDEIEWLKSCREQKSEIVKRLQSEGPYRRDGRRRVNDAPASGAGSCRYCDGHRTDVAMESAGVTFGQRRSARHRQGAPLESNHHAQHPQNLFFALSITHWNSNGSGRALSVLRHAPESVIASLAMTFSSVSVISTHCA